MIVNHVSRAMGAKRLTIREVADRSGLAYATVQGIRNGTSKRVDWHTLDTLCRVLEVDSIADLIEYVPDERRRTPAHTFIPLSGSQGPDGRYQRCGVDGCMVTPEYHRRASSTAAEGG